MWKKVSVLLIATIISMAILVGCGNSKTDAEGAKGAFIPSKNVEFVVTSSAGGGSDTFARTISDIMTKHGICSQTILINNITDGNGEVGRLTVAQTKGDAANHTLLSMNSGDCMDMLKNTDNRVENFKTIATMAVDKQLLFIGKDSKHKNFKDILDDLNSGKKVVIGGSKGSDINTYELLIDEINVDKTEFKYVVYDSTSDAITSILGGHVDVAISKPAAALQYVEAGSLVPILALSDQRFPGILEVAPTLSELGSFNDVEGPVWRSVVAPKEMSDEAVAFWSDALSKVVETEEWKDYISKNSLLPDYRSFEDTAAYIKEFEKNYLA